MKRVRLRLTLFLVLDTFLLINDPININFLVADNVFGSLAIIGLPKITTSCQLAVGSRNAKKNCPRLHRKEQYPFSDIGNIRRHAVQTNQLDQIFMAYSRYLTRNYYFDSNSPFVLSQKRQKPTCAYR